MRLYPQPHAFEPVHGIAQTVAGNIGHPAGRSAVDGKTWAGKYVGRIAAPRQGPLIRGSPVFDTECGEGLRCSAQIATLDLGSGLPVLGGVACLLEVGTDIPRPNGFGHSLEYGTTG